MLGDDRHRYLPASPDSCGWAGVHGWYASTPALLSPR